MLADEVLDQSTEHMDIPSWNNDLLKMAQILKTDKPDVNIFTIDTSKIFTQVLNNPASYPQTVLYKNTTAFCDAYAK
jgi:hypothetical protein